MNPNENHHSVGTRSQLTGYKKKLNFKMKFFVVLFALAVSTSLAAPQAGNSMY